MDFYATPRRHDVAAAGRVRNVLVPNNPHSAKPLRAGRIHANTVAVVILEPETPSII